MPDPKAPETKMPEPNAPISLIVNGERREAPAETSLRDLLLSLSVRLDAVAVAVNGEVVPRARYAEREINQDDRVEVIRAVGGG